MLFFFVFAHFLEIFFALPSMYIKLEINSFNVAVKILSILSNCNINDIQANEILIKLNFLLTNNTYNLFFDIMYSNIKYFNCFI